MNKKISLGAAIAYMAIVAAVAFSLTMIYSMNLFNVKMTGITEREKMYSSLHEVDLYVRENYYGSINEEALQEAIARGYIDGLEDSNARYFTAAEYEAYTQSGSGKYVGVGLVTEMDSSGYLLGSGGLSRFSGADGGHQGGGAYYQCKRHPRDRK